MSTRIHDTNTADTTDPPKKKHSTKNTIIVSLVGLGLLGFGASQIGGTTEPADSISESGNYVAGEDIKPGYWKITGKGDHGTVQKPCKWSVYSGEVLIDSSATTAAGQGIPVEAGQELISNHCGDWAFVDPSKIAADEALEAERAALIAEAMGDN